MNKPFITLYRSLLLSLIFMVQAQALFATVDSVQQTLMDSPGEEQAGDTSAIQMPEPARVSDKEVVSAFSDSLGVQQGSPVIFNNQELFRLYDPIGAIPVEERAEQTSRLLDKFFRSAIPVDSLTIAEGDTLSAIRTPEEIIAAFSDIDAEKESMSRQELAITVLKKIILQTTRLREESSGKSILFSLLKSIALFLALTVVWHYLNSFFTFLDGWIQKLRLHHRTNSESKLIQLLSPDHLAAGFGWFSRVTELFLKILLIYAYLATVFSFFPWTSDLSTNLLEFVLQPGKKLISEFVALIPNGIAVLILITIIRYLGKFSDVVFHNIDKGELKFVGFEREWAEPTRKIVKIILYFLLAFLLFASLPLFKNQASIVIVIIFGLTFSLSAVPSVKNVISSIMLNYTGSFRLGDHVQIGAIKGEIIYKGLLITRIRNVCNEIVIIPNSQVFHSKIVNYTESIQKNGHLTIEVVFHLKENIKTEVLRQKIVEAALATEGIMLDPKPVVSRAENLNGKYGFKLRANTQKIQQIEHLHTKLSQNIQDRLLDNNIR
ncbi:MAG: mechanosensitive ion channel family protein [Prosthecochloris sp.]|uniref:MscS Mechanosensitive ion channel n=1 Tax=Prosthecochloris aestuarii (strain DSM 271 / SK 413) TaxID=290512 RepID=B4S9C0_PROA2|nr:MULTISPECIES: mechanosensitive ion channel domain-containing protein [Prosthecochloris]ACF46590.1 MscS Mechanosensitive ion channel [Prosthecochloris aestuarii DSM 271]MCW8798343.1 mechanosensitive ion channel family protein [Prosthecochloris sp.]RDD29865.1 mechanosensitive ion channel protein MscS [Prosthecochloris sp. ZM]